MGPLEGVRVLDFTRYQQGPYATSLLADLGADVIKIEGRLEGEMGRRMEGLPNGFSPYFESYNRGKRSLTLDPRRPEGKAIIWQLLEQVDVLVENFRPGVMDRLGFGYEAVHARFPRLVYGSASAFGPKGPLATRPGFDHIAQAVSGLMVEQAVLDGADPQPGLPGMADQISATMFAFGIASALIARERTGEGQHVAVSLYGSMLAFQGRQLTRFMLNGQQGRKRYRRSPTYSHYRCADGWIAIAANQQEMWVGLCRALDRPEWNDDPRFCGPWERDAHAAELEAALEGVFATRPVAEWLARLIKDDVPCGPVNGYGAVIEDEQAWVNGYLTTIDHPTMGAVRTAGIPLHFSGTPPAPLQPAPELGQHTEDVLLPLGYDWEHLEKLRRDEVI